MSIGNGIGWLLLTDPRINIRRNVWVVLIITMFHKIFALKANNIDPDQTPRTVASDLGLQCLLMYL